MNAKSRAMQRFRRPAIAKDSLRQTVQDGPAHIDPERVAGQIGLHVGSGEWARAFDVLCAAYEEAKADAKHGAKQERMSVAELLHDKPRVATIIEHYGIMWADELAALSYDDLLLLPQISFRQAGVIVEALNRAGLGPAKG